MQAGISTLRHHNLAQWGTERLNETMMEISLDRELTLKSKLLGRLLLAQTSKQLSGLKLLAAYNNYVKKRALRCQFLLEKMVGRARVAQGMNKVSCYQRMIQYSLKNKDYENRFKSVLTRILTQIDSTNRLNTQTALQRLRKNNEDEALQKDKRAMKIRQLIDKLARACYHKEADATGKLKFAANEIKERNRYRDTVFRGLFAHLATKQDAKLTEALRNLKEHRAAEIQLEKRRQILLNNTITRLKNGLRGKLIGALNTLKSHGLNVVPLDVMRAEAAKKLVRYLVRGQVPIAIDAMAYLKTNKDKRNVTWDSLARRLVSAFGSKSRDAFSILSNEAKTQRHQELKNRSITRKIPRACAAKLKDALLRFQQYNKELASLEQRRLAFAQKLAKKLVARSISKTAQSLEHLRSAYLEGASLEAQRRRKLIQSISKLIQAQTGKRDQGFDTLKTHASLVGGKHQALQAAKAKLLAHLVKSQRAKSSSTLHHLLMNSEITRSDAQKRSLLKRSALLLFRDRTEFTAQSDLAYCLQKLIAHALNRRILLEKHRRVVDEMKLLQVSKLKEVTHKMRIFRLTQNLLYAQRNEKMGRLIQTMYSRSIANSYKKLLKNAFMKIRLMAIFNRAEKNTIRNLLKPAYDKLKDINKGRMSRATRFLDFLSAIVRLKEKAAFSEMVVWYELKKREKMTKGLMLLESFMKRATQTRNEESYLIIKKQFYDENPWFKESVRKMWVFAPTSTQISFWKVRLLKNLMTDSVSAQVSIKLAKFVASMEKKKQRVCFQVKSRVRVLCARAVRGRESYKVHSPDSTRTMESLFDPLTALGCASNHSRVDGVMQSRSGYETPGLHSSQLSSNPTVRR